MNRKSLGWMLGTVWLIGLAMAAVAQEPALPGGDEDGQASGLLIQDIMKEATEDEPATAGDVLPSPFTSETTYQSETSFFGPTPSRLPETPGARPIKTTMIRVAIGDVAQFGYLAEPADERPIAALLMIHEWWGLNGSIKAEADHFASLGYRVFAIDLFAGRTGADRKQATALARSIEQDEALERIGLWARWLTRPAAEGLPPLKLGVAGWGWGANHALQYALEGAPVSALALFYGEVELDENRLAGLACPLMGIYAERDGWVTPERVDKFKDALAKAHLGYSIVSYDVAPGFMLEPQSLAEERAASEARQTFEAFMDRHLGEM